jgi:hypothetical protein
MLRAFVPFQAVFRQPLTFTISLLGSGISFAMTLRFCQRHWPEDGGVMLVAIGLLWELAKLHLAARGLTAVVHGGRVSERLGGLGLLVLALALAAGSVGASLGCLVQAEAHDQKRSLASSQAYARAVRELKALDDQIALLTEAAAHDLDHGYRKRALDTSQKVEELRPRRDVAEREVRGLELKGDAAALLDGELGRLLGSSGSLGRRSLRLAVHLAVAVLLEIISMVGMFLLERGFHSATAAPTGHPPRPRARSSSSRGQPPPSPVRSRTIGQAVEARPYTHRLTYRFGRAEGLLNQLGGSRRCQACRELMRRIGDYCLKLAWTDGVITDAQLRTLNTGTSWRATQGHLGLLLDVGAVVSRADGHYEVAYFLDENPSVVAREAYAQEQRDQARSRKHRERSRSHVHSTSNQHTNKGENAGKTISCDPCHAETTNTHSDDAKAATHAITHPAQHLSPAANAGPARGPSPAADRGPSPAVASPKGSVSVQEALVACEQFENTLPWAKYLELGCDGSDADVPEVDAGAEERSGLRRQSLRAPRAERLSPHNCIPALLQDDREAINLGAGGARADEGTGGASTRRPLPPTPRVAPRRPHACIPARLRDDGEAINLGVVVAALRQQGIDDRPEVADAIFRQLRGLGVTQAQLRYATYCLKIRCQKVAIEDPLAYWLAIARNQTRANLILAEDKMAA